MTPAASRTVDWYYALGSRYSYLASTRLAALERECGCTFRWRPIDSVALMAGRPDNPFATAHATGQYDWGYRERDAMRWAALYGVPFREPRGRVRFEPRLLALAASAACALGDGSAYSRMLFEAVFVDDLRVIDAAECIRRATACGIEAGAFEQALGNPATAAALDETTDAARAAGVFGVPSFVVDGELFWGNDRLPLLKHRLRSPATPAD